MASEAKRLEELKSIAREFYDLSFNRRRPREAVEKFLGPKYVQHNPLFRDGPMGFATGVEVFLLPNPELKVEFKRIVAEGDLVVFHCHIVRHPGDRGMVAIDIFRFEGRTIVEHWDSVQEIPESSRNPNSMF